MQPPPLKILNKSSSKTKVILALLFFWVIISLFFPSVLMGKKTFFYRDIFRFFYPIRFLAKQALSEGVIPLWNPYVFSGRPFLANLQSAVFYPPALIYYLLPFTYGFNLFILFHLLLAGMGTYLLLSLWGLPFYCALWGGLAFSGSGFLLSSINTLSAFCAASWLPWVIWSENRWFIRSQGSLPKSFWRNINFYLPVIFLSLQFLSGEPQVTYCSWLMLLFFALGRFISCLRQKSTPKTKIPAQFFYQFSPLIIGAVGMCILCAFQLLPFLEFVALSERSSALSYKETAGASVAFIQLLNFLQPHLFNHRASGLVINAAPGKLQGWLLSFYPGLLVVLLALGAVIWSYKNKSEPKLKTTPKIYFPMKTFLSIMLLSLLLALGKFTPFHKLIFNFFPGFNRIFFPVKYLLYFCFALVLLSARGLLAISQKKFLTLLIKISLVFLGLFLLTFIGLKLFSQTTRDWIEKEQLFMPFLTTEKILHHWQKQILLSALLLTVTGLGLFLAQTDKFNLKYLGSFLIGILVINLYWGNARLNPLAAASIFKVSTPNLKKLTTEKELCRFYVLPSTRLAAQKRYGEIYALQPENYALLKEIKDSLTANLPMLNSLYDVYGYGPLTILQYMRLLSLCGQKEISVEGKLKLLGWLNVKYLLQEQEAAYPPDQSAGISPYKLIENPHFLSRVRLVNQAYFMAESHRPQIANLLTDNFNKQFILLETNQQKEVPNFISSATGEVNITDYSWNKVVIETKSTEKAYLFLADAFYPGWKATIDQEKVSVLKANFACRAVLLPSGKHQVIFYFAPNSFRLGCGLSIIGLLWFLMLILLRSGYKER